MFQADIGLAVWMHRRVSKGRFALELAMPGLFAYGSLLIPDSLSAGLGRIVDMRDYTLCRCHGVLREWSAYAAITPEALDRSVDGVFLNLAPAPDEQINGAIVKISDRELDELQVREKHYERWDVTAQIAPTPDEVVFTFVMSRPQAVRRRGVCALYPERYQMRIAAAAAKFGADFAAEFENTTTAPAVAGFSGAYAFDDIAQQSRV